MHLTNISDRHRFDVRALTYCDLKAINVEILVEVQRSCLHQRNYISCSFFIFSAIKKKVMFAQVVRRFPCAGGDLASAISADLTCNLRFNSHTIRGANK